MLISNSLRLAEGSAQLVKQEKNDDTFHWVLNLETNAGSCSKIISLHELIPGWISYAFSPLMIIIGNEDIIMVLM